MTANGGANPATEKISTIIEKLEAAKIEGKPCTVNISEVRCYLGEFLNDPLNK